MYRICCKWFLVRLLKNYKNINKALTRDDLLARYTYGIPRTEFLTYISEEKHFRMPISFKFLPKAKIKELASTKKFLSYVETVSKLFDDCIASGYIVQKGTLLNEISYEVSPKEGEDFLTISGLIETILTSRKLYFSIIFSIIGVILGAAFFWDSLGFIGKLIVEKISGVKL